MRRISRKAAATFALSVVMIFTIVVSALAGTALSNYSYFTCGSYGYKNQAEVMTTTYGAYASTYIHSDPSVTRPAGWYGAKARLYNDSGVLVKWTDFFYSSSAATGFAKMTGAYTVKGNYYSYGISQSWTGSAYHGHATWTSPSQTY
ncbi:MAG: hypothetical protein QME41_07160 [Actinomycetota bacterium]|nr:hypothetical protein [Actinomycetota bacterium]